jgi:hypothetical protein
MWRLILLAREEFWLLLFGFLSLGITSASVLVVPHYAGQMIDVIATPSLNASSTPLESDNGQKEVCTNLEAVDPT